MMTAATKKRTNTPTKRAAAPIPGRLADLHVATQTIGRTHADRLAWVVRFTNEAPASWHSATRTAHGDCLVSLSLGGVPLNVAGGDVPAPLDAAFIGAIHAELRDKLRALVNGPPGSMIAWRMDGATQGLVRLTAVGVKPAQFASTHGHMEPRTAILHAVYNLILQAGERLVGCPVCGAPMIANRKRLFCSLACAQRARNDRNAPKRRKRG